MKPSTTHDNITHELFSKRLQRLQRTLPLVVLTRTLSFTRTHGLASLVREVGHAAFLYRKLTHYVSALQDSDDNKYLIVRPVRWEIPIMVLQPKYFPRIDQDLMALVPSGKTRTIMVDSAQLSSYTYNEVYATRAMNLLADLSLFLSAPVSG